MAQNLFANNNTSNIFANNNSSTNIFRQNPMSQSQNLFQNQGNNNNGQANSNIFASQNNAVVNRTNTSTNGTNTGGNYNSGYGNSNNSNYQSQYNSNSYGNYSSNYNNNNYSAPPLGPVLGSYRARWITTESSIPNSQTSGPPAKIMNIHIATADPYKQMGINTTMLRLEDYYLMRTLKIKDDDKAKLGRLVSNQMCFQQEFMVPQNPELICIPDFPQDIGSGSLNRVDNSNSTYGGGGGGSQANIFSNNSGTQNLFSNNNSNMTSSNIFNRNNNTTPVGVGSSNIFSNNNNSSYGGTTGGGGSNIFNNNNTSNGYGNQMGQSNIFNNGNQGSNIFASRGGTQGSNLFNNGNNNGGGSNIFANNNNYNSGGSNIFRNNNNYGNNQQYGYGQQQQQQQYQMQPNMYGYGAPYPNMYNNPGPIYSPYEYKPPVVVMNYGPNLPATLQQVFSGGMLPATYIINSNQPKNENDQFDSIKSKNDDLFLSRLSRNSNQRNSGQNKRALQASLLFQNQGYYNLNKKKQQKAKKAMFQMNLTEYLSKESNKSSQLTRIDNYNDSDRETAVGNYESNQSFDNKTKKNLFSSQRSDTDVSDYGQIKFNAKENRKTQNLNDQISDFEQSHTQIQFQMESQRRSQIEKIQEISPTNEKKDINLKNMGFQPCSKQREDSNTFQCQFQITMFDQKGNQRLQQQFDYQATTSIFQVKKDLLLDDNRAVMGWLENILQSKMFFADDLLQQHTNRINIFYNKKWIQDGLFLSDIYKFNNNSNKKNVMRFEVNINDPKPIQTQQDYSIEPPIARLDRLRVRELQNLDKFVVQNQHGMIIWEKNVDVSFQNIDASVDIGEDYVSVYNNQDFCSNYPQVGEKLNRPCEITFFTIPSFLLSQYSRDPKNQNDLEHQKIEKLLRGMTQKFDKSCQFINYDHQSLNWSFRVQHFSTYQFSQDMADLEEQRDETEEPNEIENRNEYNDHNRVRFNGEDNNNGYIQEYQDDNLIGPNYEGHLDYQRNISNRNDNSMETYDAPNQNGNHSYQNNLNKLKFSNSINTQLIDIQEQEEEDEYYEGDGQRDQYENMYEQPPHYNQEKRFKNNGGYGYNKPQNININNNNDNDYQDNLEDIYNQQLDNDRSWQEFEQIFRSSKNQNDASQLNTNINIKNQQDRETLRSINEKIAFFNNSLYGHRVKPTDQHYLGNSFRTAFNKGILAAPYKSNLNLLGFKLKVGQKNFTNSDKHFSQQAFKKGGLGTSERSDILIKGMMDSIKQMNYFFSNNNHFNNDKESSNLQIKDNTHQNNHHHNNNSNIKMAQEPKNFNKGTLFLPQTIDQLTAFSIIYTADHLVPQLSKISKNRDQEQSECKREFDIVCLLNLVFGNLNLDLYEFKKDIEVKISQNLFNLKERNQVKQMIINKYRTQELKQEEKSKLSMHHASMKVEMQDESELTNQDYVDREQLFKARLSQFLQEYLSNETDNLFQKAVDQKQPFQIRLLILLSGHQIREAVDQANQQQRYKLAALIGSIPGLQNSKILRKCLKEEFLLNDKDSVLKMVCTGEISDQLFRDFQFNLIRKLAVSLWYNLRELDEKQENINIKPNFFQKLITLINNLENQQSEESKSQPLLGGAKRDYKHLYLLELNLIKESALRHLGGVEKRDQFELVQKIGTSLYSSDKTKYRLSWFVLELMLQFSLNNNHNNSNCLLGRQVHVQRFRFFKNFMGQADSEGLQESQILLLRCAGHFYEQRIQSIVETQVMMGWIRNIILRMGNVDVDQLSQARPYQEEQSDDFERVLDLFKQEAQCLQNWKGFNYTSFNEIYHKIENSTFWRFQYEHFKNTQLPQSVLFENFQGIKNFSQYELFLIKTNCDLIFDPAIYNQVLDTAKIIYGDQNNPNAFTELEKQVKNESLGLDDVLQFFEFIVYYGVDTQEVQLFLKKLSLTTVDILDIVFLLNPKSFSNQGLVLAIFSNIQKLIQTSILSVQSIPQRFEAYISHINN